MSRLITLKKTKYLSAKTLYEVKLRFNTVYTYTDHSISGIIILYVHINNCKARCGGREPPDVKQEVLCLVRKIL